MRCEGPAWTEPQDRNGAMDQPDKPIVFGAPYCGERLYACRIAVTTGW